MNEAVACSSPPLHVWSCSLMDPWCPAQSQRARGGVGRALPTLSGDLLVCQARYVQAKLSVHDRSLKVATVIESLEMEMELLCLTGVEDQLQADVRPTLETLRNAGIKVGLAPGSGAR